MALFPTNPTNGETTVVNGITYTYNSAQTAWIRTSTIPPGDLNITGNVIATGNISGSRLVSNVATGTAPLTVSSTTLVTNLNADLLDGYNSAVANTANTVAVRNSDGNLAANFFIGNGSQLTGIITSVSNVSNGNSNLDIPASNGNINLSVAGNSNILVVTGTGVNVAGTLNASGNANVGNLGTAQVLASANVTAPQLISNVAAGTAPLVVASNTVVANLNADLLDGFNSASANTANTIALRDASGNLSANFFIGNGSQLTGLSTASISNGNSNVNIPAANGNVNISAVGNANVLVVTGTGANITGTANVSGNLSSGNANLGNAATANFFIGSGNNLSNIQGANVTGTVATATTAGTVTTAAQPNITSVGTLTSADVTGNVTAGNVYANSGTIGASIGVLTTGNIATINSGLMQNGNSNVTITANGNVTLYAVGGARVAATSTGANVLGTLGVSGNANVGNLGAAQLLASANVTAPQLISNVATGTAPFVVTSTTQVANLNAATAGTATSATSATNAAALLQNTSTATTVYPTFSTSGANGNSQAVINNSITANLGNASITATTFVGALSGAATTAGTVTTAAQPNITSVGTLTSLGVSGTVTAPAFTANTGVFTGNGSGLSAIAGANVTGTVSAATTAGTVTTAAQPNITSVGTLSSLAVTANANVGNLNSAGRIIATDNLIVGSSGGEGGQLVLAYAGVNGITGQANSTWNMDVDSSNNFRLFSQNATGVVSAITMSAYSANNNVAFTGNVSANYFIGNGSQLTGISASFPIANGTSNINAPASGGNINFSIGGTANVVQVTSSNLYAANTIVSNAANGSAFVATGNAINNVALGITTTAGTAANMAIRDLSTVSSVMYFDVSVGGTANGTFLFRTNNTFASLATISNAGIAVNTGVFIGNGNSLSSLQGANVTGQVGNALVAGTVYTAAQPNITSVGTLSSLAVTGNANVGNVNATGTVIAPTIAANTNGTGQNFKVGDDTWIGDINTADTMSIQGQQNAANGFIVFGNNDTTAKFGRAGSGPLSYTGAMAISANITTPQFISNVATGTAPFVVTSTTQVANLSVATAGSATTAGTVTTAAQPNITSVGTLSSLAVTGNVTAGNVYANSGTIGASLLTGTLTTAAQPNVTSVGTLTSASVTGNVTAGNVYANSGTIGASLLTGTLTTAAQPNITSVGTLTSAAVTGNVTAGNVYSNSGTIGASLLTGTLTTAAQPNITSVGTLTSATVTGNVAAGNLTTTGVLSVAGTGVSSIAGNLDMTSNNIINLATPVNSTDAATKQYVDDVAQGLHTHDSCNAATQTTLATISGGTVTYNNGTSGVGATLTTTGSYTTIDGVTLSNGMRILVKNEANTAHNGIYDRTSSTVLTRSTDFDTPTEMAGGDFTFVNAGTLYDNTGWVMPDPVTTVGTSAVVWVQFSGAGTYTAGTGLTLTGSQFSVNVAQPTITSVGTLTGLAVNGNITAANITANTGVFTGNGSGLSAIAGANVTGTVSAATTAGTVTTAAQPNITSVSTSFSGLTFVANAQITMSGAGSQISGVNLISANSFSGNGSSITGINASSIASGTLAQARLANSNVILGSTTLALGTTTTTIAGLSSVTSTTFVGALTGAATTAGTVTTAAQPNITSVGTLTSLGVNGTVTAVAFTANTGVFTGNGSGLSAIAGANVTGTVSSATTAGTVTTAAQPNITSVGTLSSLTVSGNASAGNLNTAGAVVASTLTSNVATGTAPLTVTSTTRVANLNVAQANLADFISVSAGTGNNFLVFANAATGNVSELTSTGLTANLSNNSITATTFVGALSGAATSATTAGTVTTAAQPNITSVGTLTSLGVNGTITGTRLISNIATGTAPLTVTSNTVVTNLNADLLDGYNTATANTANTVAVRDASGNLAANFFIGNGSQLTGVSATSTFNIANGTSNVSIPVASGNINFSVAGNANMLVVTGSNVQMGSGTGGTISGANLVSANFFTGTLTTAAQPNITSVGTLTSLGVSGTVTAPAFTANTGVFTGNGSGLSAIAGANVTGTVSSATTAGTVTTAAQPNITSVGTLTVLNVNGTATITTGNVTTINSGLMQNGNSNVTVTTNGNVTLHAVGGARIIATSTGANITGTLGVSGNANVLNLGTSQVLASANVIAPQLISNVATGTAPLVVTSTTQVANLNAATAGTATSATTAGTVTTAAQPNITSVGTLTSLSVTGNASAGNITTTGQLVSSVATGTAPLVVTSTTQVANLNSAFLNGFNWAIPAGVGTTTPNSGAFTTLTASGNAFLATSSGNVGIGTTSPKTRLQVSGIASLNAPVLGNAANAPFSVTGTDPGYGFLAGINAGTGHVWLQAQRTDGTATAYNITLNEAGGNVGIGNSAPAHKLSVTGTTSLVGNVTLQSNIAYVSPNGANTINSTMLNGGTLAWSGNAGQLFSIADSMTGNIFTVNDVSGIPMISVDAGGNIQFAASGGFVSYGVTTGITAAGSTQGTATTLTRPINVISTVSSGANGIILPTIPAGARILIVNTSANALNVYPPSGAVVNSAATNAAYSQPAGARLEYISISTTQWYTLNATYG